MSRTEETVKHYIKSNLLLVIVIRSKFLLCWMTLLINDWTWSERYMCEILLIMLNCKSGTPISWECLSFNFKWLILTKISCVWCVIDNILTFLLLFLLLMYKFECQYVYTADQHFHQILQILHHTDQTSEFDA